MVSFEQIKGSFKLPKINPWGSVSPQIQTVLRNLTKRFASASITLGVLLACIAFVVLSFGIHIPFIGNSSQAAGTNNIKPRIVATSSIKASCEIPVAQNNSLFTACPSFYIDYSKQQTGIVSSNIFNTYTGPAVANNESEYYTGSSNNLRVANGSLIIEARNQSAQGYDFTSAHIDTHGKEDFLYGKLVVRATLPDGIGTWPAIWLLPSQPKYANKSSIDSPTRYLNDGEVDIAESVGTEPNVVYGVAHSIAYPEDGTNHAYYNTVTVPNNNLSFHDYEIDWTPTSITFMVDGSPYFTYSKKPNADWRSWPYDQPYYLVLNLALGGSWGGTDKKDFPGTGIDKSALPADLKIQSVQYYSYTGSR
jgi:hypothetical protein